MSHISKPVDWEVFNIPPVQPVHYHSILKKKREFSQLIKHYDSNVFKESYLHYCGIVPKSINSTLNNEYEIVIVFFDEIPNASSIGFRVKVSQETFLHESNSLLLFLKKSRKAIFYLMNNNHIHVQCGTNAWELFYLLYDHYLRRYVLTIIGTRFFYHFVYSFCIEREIQLLEILFKGSKVIRVSKKSIYYKIHRKRKISVTDLIYMTLNMPKSKRCVISCFNTKESILYSDLKNSDVYTAIGSKINISKLMLKKLKKQNNIDGNSLTLNKMLSTSDPVYYSHLEPLVLPKFKTQKPEKRAQEKSFSNTTLKRKSNENFDMKEPGPSTSKSSKTLDLHSVENQWKQYHNLKLYTVKSYSGISFGNPLVPNFLKNENLYLLKTYSNTFIPPLMTSNTQERCEVIDHINAYKNSPPLYLKKNNCRIVRSISEKSVPCESKKSISLETHLDCVMPSVPVSNLPNFQGDPHEKPQPCSDSFDFKKDCNFVSLPRTAVDLNTNSFTTTASPAIKANISNPAIFKSHQLIANDFDKYKETLQEMIPSNSNKSKKYKAPLRNFKINYPCSKRKNISHLKGNENKYSCDIAVTNEMTSNESTVLLSNIDECFRLDNLDTVEDMDFSTATGKTINISNTAMETAQKLTQKVFDA